MKKRVALIFLLSVLLIIPFGLAAGEKMEISLTKEKFASGEHIPLKVSLLASNNNPLDGDVRILIEDANQIYQIEKTIAANEIIDIDLGEEAPAGYWKIVATYTASDSTKVTANSLFMIEVEELVKFELKDNVLTIINTGNTRYTKTIQIVIGETIGAKEINLGVGESLSFRLVAPEGMYNVKITDGKNTLTRSGVALTGKAIGVLDNEERAKSGLTTTVEGEESPYEEQALTSGNYLIVYIFLLVIFGAAILLAIERRYKKKALENKQD